MAIVQVGAQTETELKEKKLRVEDALNATKAAVQEGIVIGGGCTLLKLAAKVSKIRDTLDNEEQKIGADIVERALGYPLKLIAENAGVNGSVVMEKVQSAEDPNYGFNAAAEAYGDMIEMGILDPTKVVRTALQNAASVSGLLITTECMVAESPKEEKAMPDMGDMGGMGGMGGMM